MIAVFVADDHHLVRQGICALLSQEKNIEVVGEAADGREAVNRIKTLKPHVALIDISMPSLDGIQTTQQIVSAGLDTKVIILSMHDKPNIVKEVLLEGAQGYLLKNAVSKELNLAINAAVAGHVYLSPQISGQILREILASDSMTLPGAISQLTAREREVLQLVAEGNTNKQIAELLYITTSTVEKHRSNLMKKLNASDIPTLIRTAIKEDLIFLE